MNRGILKQDDDFEDYANIVVEHFSTEEGFMDFLQSSVYTFLISCLVRIWVDIYPRIPDLRTYQETIKHFIVRFGDGGSEKLKWAPVWNKGLEII